MTVSGPLAPQGGSPALLRIASAPELVAHLADRAHGAGCGVAGAEWIGAPHPELADHAPGDAGLAPRRVGHAPGDRAEELWHAARPLLIRFGGAGDDGVEIDRRRIRRLPGRLDVRLGQAPGADAVGDGVVDLPHQRPAAALHAFDDVEHPQRAGPVVWVLVDRRDQVEQLPLRSRRGEGETAEVVVEVELRIGTPHGGSEAADAGRHPLTQAGHVGHGRGDLAAEVLEVERPVEQHQRAAARVQPWVLLDVPHQRLGVGHLPFEALLAWWPLLDHASLLRNRCRAGE